MDSRMAPLQREKRKKVINEDTMISFYFKFSQGWTLFY
jgi:hypothetical protein